MPNISIIKLYAKKLGVLPKPHNQLIQNFPDSGFIVLKNKDVKLIFNCSNIEPRYQPGHNHADTMSFELSFGKKRLLVNSGISEYKYGKKRLFQRGTRSHNTVEIDDMNSSEVWSSFRVGKRAKILTKSINEKNEDIRLIASHDGYSYLFKKQYTKDN